MKRALATIALMLSALAVAIPPTATTHSVADGLPRCCV